MKFVSLLILTVLSLGLSVTVFAADSSKLSYRQNKIVYQAQKSLEVGDALQCTKIVHQYLNEHQSAPYQFYSLLGACQYQRQDYTSATQAFTKAFGLKPKNAEISSGLATCQYLSGNYSAAGKQFLTTYRLSTNKDQQLLYQSAVAFYMDNDFRQSVGVLKQLLQETEVHDSAWNELFLSCYLELKEWTAAENHLQKLLLQKPEHEPYWRLLAQLHLQQQNYQQAAYAMEVVSRLQPPSIEDLKTLAGLYSYLNIPLRAADLLTKAYGSDPVPKQIEELAGLYQRGYDYAAAMKVAEQGMKRWPDSMELKTLASQLLYQLGRYQDVLQSSAETSLQNPQQSLLQGYAAWHLGEWLQAKNLFRQALTDKQYRSQSRHALDVLELLLQAAADDSQKQQAYAQLKP